MCASSVAVMDEERTERHEKELESSRSLAQSSSQPRQVTIHEVISTKSVQGEESNHVLQDGGGTNSEKLKKERSTIAAIGIALLCSLLLFVTFGLPFFVAF